MKTKTNTSTNKLFFKYVLLNVISMIGLSFYILADTIFISRNMGNTGLTALNLVLPIYSLVNGIGLMLGMGGSIRYSILCGEGNLKNASKTFTQTIYLALAFGFLFTAVGAFFSGDIARLLGADAVVMPMASSYLRTILLFSCAFMVNTVIVCFVRNDNNPKLSMIAMLAGSFGNVILDYIFIFHMNLGIFGAAFATGLAPIISIIILSVHLIQKKNRFKLVKTSLQKKYVKKIFSLGLPSLFTEVSSGLIMLLFNFEILNLIGNIGVAAYGIIANLALIVVAVFTGIAQGIQPILSINFGAGNKDNIKKVLRYAVILAFCIGFAFYIAGSVYPNVIIQLFNKEHNAALADMATQGIRLYFISFFFMGFNILTSSFFASINQPAKAFTVSLARGFITVIPFIFILSHFLQMTGVWLTIPCAEVITLLLSLFLIKNYLKNDISMHPPI